MATIVPSDPSEFEADAISLWVNLLDMGSRKYGDSILCRYQDTTILIDGGHSADYDPSNGTPSIPQQLRRLLGGGPPFHVSLLVVTHCHSDHIGCLYKLVNNGELTADWALVADERLGFGHALSDDSDTLADPRLPEGLPMLIAALREDTRADVGDDELREFMQDAYWLEPRYKEMLGNLEAAGTRIVRYGRDDHGPLVDAMDEIGLSILGPTQNHLLICAEAIRRFTHDAAGILTGVSADSFTSDRLLETYRSFADNPAVDAVDSPGKGAALNDQSIVLMLEAAGRKVLLTGDMQLAKAEVDGLDTHMDQLRATIAQEAPFDFVKVAHHSSYNGLDQSLYEEWGDTSRYGHTGGSGSSSHPHPRVLHLLEEHEHDVKWCRTDRNGIIRVRLSPGGVWIFKEHGELNDFTPNRRDIVTIPAEPAAPVAATTAVRVAPAGARPVEPPALGVVEVTARIPHSSTRVVLTVDVEPRGRPQPVPRVEAIETSAREAAETTRLTDRLPRLLVGGGRNIPRLLFATNRDGLRSNIGSAEADHVLAALRASEHDVLDSLPAGNVSDATALVREKLVELDQSGAAVHGVVILGGYDVVPSQRLDVLDPDLRAALGWVQDFDKFIVWSDEVYGDKDGDALPELPVSRIPDGQSAELVFAALQATDDGAASNRFGVRNIARPFADGVFDSLPGSQNLFVSSPSTWRDIPSLAPRTETAYFMLHGAAGDGSLFWGEGPPGEEDPEAVSLETVPDRFSGVVLTGCCWGALCAGRPAVRVQPGQHVVGRSAKDSIALSYLKAGAKAFVGCTGTHYSPTEAPYGYFGEPMHRSFWRTYLAGTPPARALFDAKVDYLNGIPYLSSQPAALAIETKILRQFTCLGLGW